MRWLPSPDTMIKDGQNYLIAAGFSTPSFSNGSMFFVSSTPLLTCIIFPLFFIFYACFKLFIKRTITELLPISYLCCFKNFAKAAADRPDFVP
jgi:hypothetical protein